MEKVINVEILNRQARHNYFIESTYECGIVLKGTEVKSIRAGKCHLKDSYAIVRNGEIFLLNMFISHYKEGSIFNENETRTRKLLLHQSEIRKLNDEVKLKGLSLVPLKLYFVKDKVKIELGVCRGKKNYDKRETIKQRDLQRAERKETKYKY